MKIKKPKSDKQTIIARVYDPGHKWESDLWILKLLGLIFIIANFHWINKTPILKLGLIAVSESLFLIYTLLFIILLKNKISFRVQFLNLVLDFLFIVFFDYLSLSFFGYDSRVYALYLIPVIYCSYWFKWSFTLYFVALVSGVYALLNYYTPDMGIFYTTGEKTGKLLPIIVIFYICVVAVIFYKKKIERDFVGADQELKERAEKLEQVKESTQTLLKDKIDGFMAIDEKGKITEANQLAREFLGYSENEILGKNVEEIYAPGEAKRIMEALRQSPDGTINIKAWHQSKEGEKMLILLSASFLYDKELNLKAMLSKGKKFPSIGYFRDIRAEEIFADITRKIAYITNERILLDRIVKKVAATIKSETCSVFIYNEQSGLIESISRFGIPGQLKGKRGMEVYAETEGETGNVFSSGETRNVSNIDAAKEEPKDCKIRWEYARGFAKHSRFRDFKHFLGTPLRIQGEVYGVIRVLNKYKTYNELDKQGFTEKDILLLKRISHQVSILLEKVRNKERFEAISRVGIELNAKVDVKLDELLGIIARGVVDGMKFKACTLRLIEESNKLRIKAYCGLTGEYKKERFTLEIGEGISGNVAETGEMRIALNLNKEEDFKFKELLKKEGLKSMLSIPLKYRGKVIGVINCYTGRMHQFTEQEIQIMETFAVYAAVAIQNKKRMDELMALNEVGSELVKPFKLEELFGHILEKAKKISGADRLCIKRYNERAGDISTLSSCDCEWHKQTKNCLFKLGDDFISEVIKKGEPKIIPDYDINMEKLDNVLNKELFADTKSCMLAPIKIYGRVFGVLCLESKRENSFNENDLLILNSFSNQVAAAVRNADFFNKLQNVKETFPRISELSIDIHEVLGKIAKIAGDVLETDVLVLFRYDERTGKIILPPIYTGDIKHKEAFEAETIFLEVPLLLIKGGKSHYADHSQEDPVMTSKGKPLPEGIPGRFVIIENIVSSAGIILRVGKEIVGVMFINYRTPHEFNADERQIIEIFASYIALAIQNVMHFSEKKAADTVNTIGKLAGNFAHKIKNDIGTIKLYTGDLMDGIKPDTPQYFPLTQIKEKILKITSDLNFLSTISKAYSHEKKLIDVNDLVRELKSEILPDLEMKKITFEIEIQPGLPGIEIDPTRIKMVFINLAQNSIDAMPGGGKIFLSIAKSDKTLVFEWKDTGSGIPPEYAHKIFDVLWSTKENGSGLGLFYARTIIEEHGGSISLDATHKGGARFVILLPISEQRDPEAK